MRRVCFVMLFAGLIAGFSSCSNGEREPLNTVPVSGTVYLDRKPLENAEIRFYTQDFVGFAVTGADGKYELSQGAMPGENRVTIQIHQESYDLDPESGHDMGQIESARESALGLSGEMATAAAKAADKSVPSQYSDPEKTQLKIVVPEEGKEGADFRITSK